MVDAFPISATTNSSHKCCTAPPCSNRSKNRKDLKFHTLFKVPHHGTHGLSKWNAQGINVNKSGWQIMWWMFVQQKLG